MPAGGQVAPLSLLLISTPSCLAWPQNTGYSDREAPNSWCTSKCFLRLEIEDEWVCCWTRRVNCTLIPYRCNIWYTSTCCCDAFWLHVAGGQQHKFAFLSRFYVEVIFFFFVLLLFATRVSLSEEDWWWEGNSQLQGHSVIFLFFLSSQAASVILRCHLVYFFFFCSSYFCRCRLAREDAILESDAREGEGWEFSAVL